MGRMFLYWGDDGTNLVTELQSSDMKYDCSDNEDDCVIMQFTGLLDKNGKEIYEGDLLKTPMGHIGEIRWCTVTEYAAIKSNNKELDLFEYTGFGFFNLKMNKAYHLDNSISVGEIIGSLYENPEFIKTLPTETIEVNGCKGCIFHESGLFEHVCRHPKYEQPTFAYSSIKKLFTTCPLKKSSLTIKLKQNEPAGN